MSKIKNISAFGGSALGGKVLREQPGLYWARPRRAVVDVLRRAVADFDALTPAAVDRLRQSQILASDPPIKVLEEKGEWGLIQMVDLTRGWVPLKLLKKLPPQDYWVSVKRFGNQLISVKITARQFVETLKKWPAPKYVWGGRESTGQDCSGLVQAVFLKTVGYWLPKHSRDQAVLGEPVTGQWAVGDLVLMQNLDTRVTHIGIVSDPDKKIIWHHSRQNGAPRFEPAIDLVKRYKCLSISRLLSFASD